MQPHRLNTIILNMQLPSTSNFYKYQFTKNTQSFPISPPSANNSNSSNNSSVSGFPFSSTVISPRNSITSFSNPTKQPRANSINSDNGNNSNGRRTSNSNYSITSTPTTNNRYSFSEYSNEQIIDLMEREQDACIEINERN